MMSKRIFQVAAYCLICGSWASAAQINVDSLSTGIGIGAWGTSVTGGGTAELVSLAGLGGNLEANAPIPSGAVKLTTGGSSADRAEVGIGGSFGPAIAFLEKLDMAYSYFKEAVGAPAAAPALRLTIAALGGTGDNYGTLVFEPYWNQAGGVPTVGDWETLEIDADTGHSGDGSGGWWWTGGFEIGNSSGGPPLRSATEWVAAFLASDPTDFINAEIVAISVGLGSGNLNQVGYVDRVVVGDTVYNFDAAASAVPEPATMALMGLGLLGVPYMARRRKTTQSA